MKNVGVWIDKQKAHIVTLSQDGETFTTLFSEVEDFHPSGGSRSKTRWGPQDVVQDSKYLEREKHQLKNYFGNLAKAIEDADAVAIFGPADTNEKFNAEVLENHKALGKKIKTVAKADSMTENQVKAWVKDFFKK
ncbi:hypothetical protein SAMN04487911_12157 [Arenibacter nanhaiticus]|uniref:Protein required for attachment to host cells n=1 Tax=Arenibacter nanhaiticus TaxID=558155 RepID=A0A1M6JD95_9FLAO|nr:MULTISPECIES: hypothetical protein [Arenibacter]NKI25745.1 hypothetical protein [Arenibacter sp. 6A1]SHJ44562.1 hypothetical protein SAMN04487911_12157 [Arenibacter nanhaiticus]